MPSPDYPVVTDRLLLRPLDAATDVDALLAYKSMPDVVRYVPYEVRTRADIVELFESGTYRSTLDEPGQHITLGMVRRDTGALIGDVMLRWLSDVHRSAEIGYVMHPEHHGQGFVTEACRALLDYAFDGLGLHRVVARIADGNHASTRVAERLGMRAEARLVENEWFKGAWSTEVDYAILAREWRTRAGR